MSEKLYYDLHIHTALSSCADNDMTPNNIVNMAAIKELDCIAVTDHNSCANAAAVIAAADNNCLDLIVLPGMELTTSEEAHVVCLFGSMEQANQFESIIKPRMTAVKNRPEIFGEQLLMDENDEVKGEHQFFLTPAVDIGIYEAVDMVKRLGGVAIPAHVDRSSFSILSNLGFVADDLDINLVEISKQNDPEVFMAKNKALFLKPLSWLQSSDAHYLEDISERERYIRIEGERSPAAVIAALKKK